MFLLSRGSRGEPPLKERAKPSVVDKPVVKKVIVPPKGKIAIIIDDFGYNYNQVTRGFLELDTKFTYAIIPGHDYSQQFATEAAEQGHEIMIHMPMESMNQLSGEEGYILETDMTSTEIERRVRMAIEHIPQARGMNNHQGSKATQDDRLMTIVATILKQYKKYFIDSRTTAETVAETKMKAIGVQVSQRNIFLDNDSDPAMIRAQINKMADLAARRGQAVGIGHGRRSTLEVLVAEIPRLEAEGFQFVHASRIVR